MIRGEEGLSGPDDVRVAVSQLLVFLVRDAGSRALLGKIDELIRCF